jgi:GTP cyclohydrolase II/3,4-dihydroxy-2-butanone 4-phosphate synthase
MKMKTVLFRVVAFVCIVWPCFIAIVNLRTVAATIPVEATSHMKINRRWRRSQNKAVETSELRNSTSLQHIHEQTAVAPERNHWTQFVAECNLPTINGEYRMRSYIYSSPSQKLEPIAMIYGDVRGKKDVLVRVHDQCFTSEVFGSLRCDCREQLRESLKMIQEDCGVVIYLQQEGRGIGIANKVAAYALQDQGLDTVDANTHLGFKDELREYLAVPDILQDIGIESIRLMTNNPYKISQLQGLGVTITERIPIEVKANRYNMRYLRSKRDKMFHYLSEDVLENDSLQSMTNEMRLGVVEEEDTAEVEEKEEANTVVGLVSELRGGLQTTENISASYCLGKDTVIAAINAIRDGEIVIVVDDADRENEGDFIMAAEKATPESIGFIVRYSSGVLCISLEDDRLKEFELPPMVVNNEDPKQTAYTISVDCKINTTTGISSFDRATTFRHLVNPLAKKEDFQRPGHVFPLRYKPGGVLRRMGHTEASLDLTRLAGLNLGGVLAEVVHDDGSMMRFDALKEMAEHFGMVLTSVQDIKAYRMEMEAQE